MFVHTNLIYLRKKNSKTQAEIGAMLGMSLTAYGDYERESSKPSIEILAILSEYYDYTIDDLVFTDISNENPPKKSSRKQTSIQQTNNGGIYNSNTAMHIAMKY